MEDNNKKCPICGENTLGPSDTQYPELYYCNNCGYIGNEEGDKKYKEFNAQGIFGVYVIDLENKEMLIVDLSEEQKTKFRKFVSELVKMPLKFNEKVVFQPTPSIINSLN